MWLRIAIALAVCGAATSCAPAPSPPLAVTSEFEGLWQYPGRGVWIQVWPDGFVFQCRIAPDGEIFESIGTLSGRYVWWEAIWPPGSVTITDTGVLHLEDAWGRYDYMPGNPMSAPCAERTPRPIGAPG